MTPIIVELGWRGLFPAAAYHRQPCPDCSPWREKHDEPCMVITIDSDTEAQIICYHCGKYERIAA